MNDSVEKKKMFSGVVTSRGSNGYTINIRITASWVPYHINTITLGDTIIPLVRS